MWLPNFFLQENHEGVLEFRIAEILIFNRNYGLGVITALYWNI